VPERHRAAVDVDALHVGPELALPGADDRRERLVDLDQVEVADPQACAVQQLARRRDRAGEHDHRVHADRHLVDDPRPRRQPEALGRGPAGQEDRGGAVGELRRGARRDPAVLLEGRLELGERLEVRIGADALVGLDRAVRRLDRHDLAVEAPLLGGGRRAAMRLHRELVHLGPGDLPLLGDALGAEPLGNEVEAVQELLRPRVAEQLDDPHRRVDRDVVHVLDAGGDHELMAPRGDEGRPVADRRLGRPAAAVDRDRRDLDRITRLQPGVARDIARLLAERRGAAGDHVLDLSGVDTGALDQRGQA
jgi:hypothetical protein